MNSQPIRNPFVTDHHTLLQTTQRAALALILGAAFLAPIHADGAAQSDASGDGMVVFEGAFDPSLGSTFTAQPAPWNMIPVPSFRFDLEEPINPASDPYTFSVTLAPGEEVHAFLTAIRPRNVSEVFPTRTVPAAEDDARRVLWSLDPRVGDSAEFSAFEVSFTSASGELIEVVVEGTEVVAASELTDEELLAASAFSPLTPRYVQLHHRHQEQEVAVVLPTEFARRYQAKEAILSIDGQEFNRMPIMPLPGRPWQWRPTLPVSHGENAIITVTLLVDTGEEDAEPFEIASTSFETTSARIRNQFEFPYQSIYSSVVSSRGPDIMVAAILNDLLTKPEPRDAARSNREVMEATISLSTGRNELQPVKRIAAYEDWAEAGFRSLGRIIIRDDVEVFPITGSNSFGIESLGVLNFFGGSRVTPALINPSYQPDAEFVGLDEGDGLLVRGATGILSDEETRLMFIRTKAGENPARLMAVTSIDLRVFDEVGEIDIPLGDQDGDHLQLIRHNEISYLITANPERAFAASDPLGEWAEVAINFPADWSNYHLTQINGTWYIFGQQMVREKSVLRWSPIAWDIQEGATYPAPRLLDQGTNE